MEYLTYVHSIKTEFSSLSAKLLRLRFVKLNLRKHNWLDLKAGWRRRETSVDQEGYQYKCRECHKGFTCNIQQG